MKTLQATARTIESVKITWTEVGNLWRVLVTWADGSTRNHVMVDLPAGMNRDALAAECDRLAFELGAGDGVSEVASLDRSGQPSECTFNVS